jgi:hypothetical protein
VEWVPASLGVSAWLRCGGGGHRLVWDGLCRPFISLPIQCPTVCIDYAAATPKLHAAGTVQFREVCVINICVVYKIGVF